MARFPRRKDDFNHADWLSLIDVSGPFLSVPVLRRVWPALDAIDKATRERLRQEHAALPGRSWIDHVLRELLGWDELAHFTGLDALSMDVSEHHTRVAPSFALLEPGTTPGADAKNVRLLGLVCDDRPTQRIKDSDWAATPVDRLAQLCRHHDVQLGLATDGRWWALVWAPRGGVTTTAVFDSVNWHEAAERDVVRAFVSILNRARFFSVPDDETLVALLKASLDNQEDITEALGVQVRQAVELLVAAIGRAHTADVAQGGPGIGNVSAHEVYRGAVAVMMRVVFLLFAEERNLLPADKELYRTAYSAGLLCAELKERALDGSEEDLEHTYTGWHRLLALFNAVYYGVEHPEMTMHAHDGSIFDPARFDWLPLTIDDRTVLHMLQAVQEVEIGTGRAREPRKLSFRELDVEQIGYVYEGLLSFEGFYAEETVVGLIGKAGLEEEVALRTLEETAATCPDIPSLAAKLAAEYKDSRIGSAKALEKRLAPLADADAKEARRKLLAVTGGDYPLAERLMPFFGIIRTDLRELPVVILTDALFVTESSLRKNTGTHYTPKFLAEQVVEGALEPLVYSPGPLQTADKSEWKPKTSDEILSLKVADIAMGSAAFLVAACRYLAGHLVAAWLREGDERAHGYNADAPETAADADADPVVINARRHVIEHCLYGADINEMAVEMAKLSLWLVSMDPHRPFTFLDDRLVVGDSLLGITSLDQLEVMHMDAERGRRLHEGEGVLFDLTAGIRELVGRVAEKRRELVEIEGTDLARLAAKRAMLAEVEKDTERARLLADLTTGAALAYASRGAAGLNTASTLAVTEALKVMSDDEAGELAARDQLNMWLRTDLPDGAFERQSIHWPLVFPEVFEKGGFDAVIGNPPFLGGKKISGSNGSAYREFLVRVVAADVKGNADLVAYFALRCHELLNRQGQVAIIATNTLAQGDSREVGLDELVSRGVTIRRAVKSRPWPSKGAVLEYCAIWTSKATLGSNAEFLSDGLKVRGITPSLDPESRYSGNPYRLSASQGIAYQGSIVVGMGFVLTFEEAAELIELNKQNSDVIYLYPNGQDLNSRPDCTASRMIINFRDWPEERARMYEACYNRVSRLVKPERDLVKREAHRARWWRYGDYKPSLYGAIANLDRVIAITLVSKTVMPVMVPAGQVFSHALGVFATDDTAMLALLSSAPHYWWTLSKASTLETRIRYTPSDVFETMPLPEMTQEMRELGKRLDQFRRTVMLSRQTGLTETYNLIHDPGCEDGDIVELRHIHRAIDEAVCRAYGWGDLVPQLEHGHHNIGRETRHTVGHVMWREFVDRLLELNHERYAAEVAAGLHDKKKGGKRLKAGGQDGLF
ncbi:Eco57I restriction-modification methylase domain-containing protein [Actinomadura luteofluorescens]|uniref:Eco57I restriction-modification methylase domain-containing protein n=1 Tax=Actinomadura luteofluorescens TaxID=46163 RepID=UPI003D9236A7